MDENYRQEIIQIIKDMKRRGRTDKEIKKYLLNMNLPEELVVQLMDVASASLLEEEEIKIEQHLRNYIDKEEKEFYEIFDKRIKELKRSISEEFNDKINEFDKKYYEKLGKIEEEIKVVNSNLADHKRRIDKIEKNWEVFAWTSTKIRNFFSYLCILVGIGILGYFVYSVLLSPSSILLKYFTSGDIKKIVVSFLYSLIPLAASALLFVVGYYLPRLK